MNQPTREEFDAFKQEIRQEMRQLREQRTEEMKAVRVDVHNVDVETIRQELKTVSDTWLETMQEHYDEHKQDISDIKTVLSGHAKFFEEHGKRLAHIDTAMATKEDITSIKATQEQILQLLQQRGNS